MSEGSSSGQSKTGAKAPPALGWRDAFDAVERPIAAVSEAWVQSDLYMDVLAVAYKVQKQVGRELRRTTGRWLSLWDVPSRRDIAQIINQVADLERQVRDLAHRLEAPAAVADAAPPAPRRPATRARG